MFFSHALRRIPILVVYVHQYSFFGFLGFDELIFGFLELTLILQSHGVFAMDVYHLILGSQFSQFKSKFKLIAFASIVDALFKYAELGK